MSKVDTFSESSHKNMSKVGIFSEFVITTSKYVESRQKFHFFFSLKKRETNTKKKGSTIFELKKKIHTCQKRIIFEDFHFKICQKWTLFSESSHKNMSKMSIFSPKLKIIFCKKKNKIKRLIN